MLHRAKAAAPRQRSQTYPADPSYPPVTCRGAVTSRHLALNWIGYPLTLRHLGRRLRGRWEDKTTSLSPGWAFFCAEESHERTEKRWADSGLKLLGETAGRQSWDRVEGNKQASSSAASGEEPLTFNPSVNPNAGDKVLRAHQVRRRGVTCVLFCARMRFVRQTRWCVWRSSDATNW